LRVVESRTIVDAVDDSARDIQLRVPIDALPDLVRKAIAAVPVATAVEIRADGAVVGRRTNFAAFAETTVLSFHATGPSSTRVRVEAVTAAAFGFIPGRRLPIQSMESGTAVIAELQQLVERRRDSDSDSDPRQPGSLRS
jgi:hypothetical protein